MLLEIALGFVVLCLLVCLNHQRKKPAGTPPGSVGYPLVGNIGPSNISFSEYLGRLRKKYGDTFWLILGTNPYVFLTKYEDIKEAFSNPSLQNRPYSYSMNLLYGHPIDGIAFSSGNRSKNLRRFVIKHLRDRGMGKARLEDIIELEAKALTDDFAKYVGKAISPPWSINAAIMNIAWKLVADKRFELDDTNLHRLYGYVQDNMDAIRWGFRLFNWMPWLDYVIPSYIQDNYMGRKVFVDKVVKISAMLQGSIDEHKKNLDELNLVDLIDDYLYAISQKTDSDKETDLRKYFSEEALLYVILDMFGASNETTSGTMKWFLLFMIKYPHMQKKIQKEIDTICPNGRAIQFSDRDSMHYLMASLNETLRLKPPAPFGNEHCSAEDIKIGKYFIPKGTAVIGWLSACNRNPDYWQKPEDFYPENFLNADGTFNTKKTEVVTFSIGKRICLGENLARLTLFFMAASLLQKYTFTAENPEELSLEDYQVRQIGCRTKPYKMIVKNRI